MAELLRRPPEPARSGSPKFVVRGLALVGAVLALAGCGGTHTTSTPPSAGPGTAPPQVIRLRITLSSPAFTPGGQIPSTYTCTGKDISPPLRWTGVPAGTRELTLRMIDLDAPGGQFVHWMLADISPTTHSIAPGDPVPAGAVAGRNDFGNVGYGGPCPPPGSSHRYVITLAALRAPSGLQPGFSLGALWALRAFAVGELTGNYRR